MKPNNLEKKMKLPYLTGVLALTIVASASSFVSAQSDDRSNNHDMRFSAPTKGGIIVGTPGDTVMSPFEKAPFEEMAGADSADSATAIEYGLIAAMVPWMPKNGEVDNLPDAEGVGVGIAYGLIAAIIPEMPNPKDDEQTGLAINLGDGLIAVLITTAHSSELGFIKLGDIKGGLKNSSSNDELP
jgi:hypothetical protein